MEGIVAIIFIIFSVIAAASNKKDKKKQPPRKRPPMPSHMHPKANPTPIDLVVPPMKMAEGNSKSDGKCLGGSMEHTEHEGDEEAVQSVTAEEETETDAQPFFSAEDMRQAFIASEIFAKPKALRKNGT